MYAYTHSHEHIAPKASQIVLGTLGDRVVETSCWEQASERSLTPNESSQKTAESEDLTLRTPLLVQTPHTWLREKSLSDQSPCYNLPFMKPRNLFWIFPELNIFQKYRWNCAQNARHTHPACPSAGAEMKLERFFVWTSSPFCEDTQRCHGSGSNDLWCTKLGWTEKKNLFWHFWEQRNTQWRFETWDSLDSIWFKTLTSSKLLWLKKQFSLPFPLAVLRNPQAEKLVFGQNNNIFGYGSKKRY